jgi:ferredoxin-thioredoxin reductase catalytic chain
VKKTIEQTGQFVSMVAAKQGWMVNPDESFVSILVEGLTTNWNRYGYYLCPCRDTEGSRESDSAVVCPCSFSHLDVETYGYCYCSLYMSAAFKDSGKLPGSIPERRFESKKG